MTAGIPHISRQPPSVDYIDNELAEHHDLFKNPLARYDSALDKYVPIPSVDAGMVPHLSADGDAESNLPSRPTRPPVDAMTFWDSVFPGAMRTFERENKAVRGRDGSVYDIRSASDWNSVYSRLQRARERYDDTKKGFWGHAKRFNRQAADNSDPASQIVRLLPDVDYVSPVRAIVEVCLDVGQMSPLVR